MCSHLISRRSTPHRLSEAWAIWLEVFLISNDVQTSFDGRYFGPVKRENLLGRIEYLGKFKGRSERQRAGRG